MRILQQTAFFEYPLLSRGKVRDIYEIDAETLLIITTDRMSAFDVIMNEAVPFKGVILNQLTLFWMEKFKHIVPNHLISADVNDFPEKLAPYAKYLEGRSVLAKRATPLPLECIVRGCISGSGWKEYQATGMLSGQPLPAGLKESTMLNPPLFTPSTKAELGAHDENISLKAAKDLVGAEMLARLASVSLDIFTQAREYAEERGLLIADTKFEFGLINGELTLIDEVLTPDSSRFWPLEGYTPGKSQPSFDKQYLRDWLLKQNWNQSPPPPMLPDELVEQTARRYKEAYEILTGNTLPI